MLPYATARRTLLSERVVVSWRVIHREDFEQV